VSQKAPTLKAVENGLFFIFLGERHQYTLKTMHMFTFVVSSLLLILFVSKDNALLS